MESKDYLVYDHFIVPVKLHYYGYTGNEIEIRKIKGGYKRTALQYYLDQYGWDNISTTIVTEGLTKKEAELLEDQLIREGWERGDCINKQGSGGELRDNPKEYHKQRYKDHRDELLEYQNQYNNEHRDERLEYQKKYDKDHRDERKQYRDEHKEQINEYHKQYDKQRNSTPEGKIYNRVKSFNQKHPDQIKETPLEAKQKYLETGYIPSYIKNNDLK